jgi:hypothetical protein
MRNIAPERAACEPAATPEPELEPRVRALLEHLARINYVADRHREALAILGQRKAAVEAELAAIEGRP